VQPSTEESAYKSITDKAYIGKYTFDAHSFESEGLKLLIQPEGQEKVITVRFPERIRKLVVEDFKPYWKHVESVRAATVHAEVVKPAKTDEISAPNSAATEDQPI
jgi:hypothetical protein